MAFYTPIDMTSHRNNWLLPFLKRARQDVDVLKLGVTIRVLAALSGLDVCLQAIVQIMKQIGDFAISNSMTLPVQLFGQLASALACPT